MSRESFRKPGGRAAALAGALMSVSTLLLARTLTVDGSGGADFLTIQDAIDAAQPGDVILVRAGTYAESILLKSGVSVIGEGAERTTIHGGQRSSVARLLNCDASTRLQGFTLTGGESEMGAGVFIQGGAPVLTLNNITANSALSFSGYTYGLGGGVGALDSRATITDNTISGNEADFGGGLWLRRGAPLLTLNRITGNLAAFGAGVYMDARESGGAVRGNNISDNSAGFGGGLSLTGAGSPIVSNNLITGNAAVPNVLSGLYSYGGGIELYQSSAVVVNNTLAGNDAEVGGGISVIASQLRSPAVRNSILYANTGMEVGGGIYLDVAQATLDSNLFFLNSHPECESTPGTLCRERSNLSADPLLRDAAGGDFRLLPGSPAIDSGSATGAPSDDRRGQRRPLDGDGDRVAAFDRGAYEYDRDDVLGLRFSGAGTLTWRAASGATSYHVYSGALSSLAPLGTDTCRDSEDLDDPSDLFFDEGRLPPQGDGLAYLVTAVIGGIEQSPGFDSRGLERSLALPCP